MLNTETIGVLNVELKGEDGDYKRMIEEAKKDAKGLESELTSDVDPFEKLRGDLFGPAKKDLADLKEKIADVGVEHGALIKKLAIAGGILGGVAITAALVVEEYRHMNEELAKHNKRVEELAAMPIRGPEEEDKKKVQGFKAKFKPKAAEGEEKVVEINKDILAGEKKRVELQEELNKAKNAQLELQDAQRQATVEAFEKEERAAGQTSRVINFVMQATMGMKKVTEEELEVSKKRVEVVNEQVEATRKLIKENEEAQKQTEEQLALAKKAQQEAAGAVIGDFFKGVAKGADEFMDKLDDMKEEANKAFEKQSEEADKLRLNFLKLTDPLAAVDMELEKQLEHIREMNTLTAKEREELEGVARAAAEAEKEKIEDREDKKKKGRRSALQSPDITEEQRKAIFAQAGAIDPNKETANNTKGLLAEVKRQGQKEEDRHRENRRVAKNTPQLGSVIA